MFLYLSVLCTFIVLGASPSGEIGGQARSNSVCHSQRQSSAELAPPLPAFGWAGGHTSVTGFLQRRSAERFNLVSPTPDFQCSA